MHMGDELISLPVALSFLAVSSGAVYLAGRRLSKEPDEESRLPLVGVMAAFVFAAQMVNIRIPGTGSSGHLAGSLLLAVLLGPARSMICLAAVLMMQAFFFADGGILALGCNFFNMGLVGAVGGWWVYKAVAGANPGPVRRPLAAGLAAWVSVVTGSAMVVLQTYLSGLVDIPFITFMGVMTGIHALIGIVEGVITAGVITFLLKNRPSLWEEGEKPAGKLIVLLGIVTVAIGAFFSLLASTAEDGLESTLSRLGIEGGGKAVSAAHEAAAHLQEKTSFLPDYNFTSLAGVVGAALTLLSVMAGVYLFIAKRRK